MHKLFCSAIVLVLFSFQVIRATEAGSAISQNFSVNSTSNLISVGNKTTANTARNTVIAELVQSNVTTTPPAKVVASYNNGDYKVSISPDMTHKNSVSVEDSNLYSPDQGKITITVNTPGVTAATVFILDKKTKTFSFVPYITVAQGGAGFNSDILEIIQNLQEYAKRAPSEASRINTVIANVYGFFPKNYSAAVPINDNRYFNYIGATLTSWNPYQRGVLQIDLTRKDGGHEIAQYDKLAGTITLYTSFSANGAYQKTVYTKASSAYATVLNSMLTTANDLLSLASTAVGVNKISVREFVSELTVIASGQFKVTYPA